MITVKNLKKSFGELEVLKKIDCEINKGECIVVIGPSGSGKSTFLRCLNRLEEPTGGQIIFNGVDIADPKVNINIHRRHMGMVFQHFNLFNNKTVIKNIMLAPVYVKKQKEKTNAIMLLRNLPIFSEARIPKKNLLKSQQPIQRLLKNVSRKPLNY